MASWIAFANPGPVIAGSIGHELQNDDSWAEKARQVFLYEYAYTDAFICQRAYLMQLRNTYMYMLTFIMLYGERLQPACYLGRCHLAQVRLHDPGYSFNERSGFIYHRLYGDYSI